MTGTAPQTEQRSGPAAHLAHPHVGHRPLDAPGALLDTTSPRRSPCLPSQDYIKILRVHDPSDHGKVLIDHSDERARLLAVHHLEERTNAQAGPMREWGQNGWSGRYKAAQDSVAAYMSADHSQLGANDHEDAPHAQQ